MEKIKRQCRTTVRFTSENDNDVGRLRGIDYEHSCRVQDKGNECCNEDEEDDPDSSLK
jgi:hypothetical protein